MKQTVFLNFLTKIKEKYGKENVFRYWRDGEEVFKTYGEFYRDLRSTSQKYSALEEQRIGILGSTSYFWIYHAYSSILSGKETVLFDPLLPITDLVLLMRKMEIEVLILEEELLEISEDIKRKLPTVKILSYLEMEQQIQTQRKEVIQDGKTIFFTSGTSKQAKGVVIDMGEICESTKNVSKLLYGTREDLVYIPIPMHHIYGFTILLCCLGRGQEICIGNMRTLKREIEYFQPNSLIIVPSIVEYLVKAKGFVPSVKHVTVAGCLCKQSIEDAMKERGIFLQNLYGLSETIGVIAINRKGDSITKLSPCDGTELLIGKDGEIILKLVNKMEGYYKNQKATEEVLKQGLFYTGDLGVLDENGRLNVNGRKKEIIAMSNGDKISCSELDEILSEIKAVKEGAVIYKDEMLIAVICLEKKEKQENVLEDIKEYNKMQPYFRKINKVWFYAKDFPRTATGKLKRRVLEDEYEAMEKNLLKNI